MIDGSKYNQTVTLNCPTCGGTQFEHDDSSDRAKCTGCGLVLTKDSLIEANNENVTAHVGEIKEQVLADLTKSLKDAFKSNKFISFK
jgi:transcription initiation factor TFIIIB Brf1 subunit/transcription initiation factor TFIIB